MLRIALDFDGVLSHTMKSWVEKYNDLIDTPVTLRDIDKWGFFEKWGMEWPEALDIFKSVWSDPSSLEPMEHDLKQKVKMLRNFGRVDIVTAIDPSCAASIELWLNQQQIEYDSMVVVKSKADLDYDIFIDDSPDNAMKIFANDKSVLLYNQPWNRGIPNTIMADEGTGDICELTRVYNLYHAIDVIREKHG